MLTNCGDCKFNGNGEGCAVNPGYFRMFNILKELSNVQQAEIAPNVEPCREFEASPDLEEVSLHLTMSIQDWKRIANSQQPSDYGKRFIGKVRTALDGLNPPIQWEILRSDDITF